MTNDFYVHNAPNTVPMLESAIFTWDTRVAWSSIRRFSISDDTFDFCISFSQSRYSAWPCTFSRPLNRVHFLRLPFHGLIPGMALSKHMLRHVCLHLAHLGRPHSCNPRPWWPPLESFPISHRSFSKEIATFPRRHRKHIRLEFCGCRGWWSSLVAHERTCSPTFVRVRRTSEALGRRKGARGGASAGNLGDRIVDRNKAESAEIHV